MGTIMQNVWSCINLKFNPSCCFFLSQKFANYKFVLKNSFLINLIKQSLNVRYSLRSLEVKHLLGKIEVLLRVG